MHNYLNILIPLLSKFVLIGLMGIAFLAGSIMTSNMAYAANGEPFQFLEEQVAAIELIIQGLQDQLNDLHVAWDNVDNIPTGFADDIDNDLLMEISTSCTVDQIVKWDGTQWYCTMSADNEDVSWVRVDNIPTGFVDDIDNDLLMEISTSCTVDQIVKWDGIQWYCATSADNEEGGDVALRKLDCLLIRIGLEKSPQIDFVSGCDLRNAEFNEMDITGANLSYADLTGAGFDEGNISRVDFTGANLSNVDFSVNSYTDAIFTDAYADPSCRRIPICNTLPSSPSS